MRTLIPAVLLVLTFSLTSEAVIVQEGEFKFPLESVKKLWAIMAEDAPPSRNSRLAVNNAVAVCKNPGLPEQYQPLCQSKNARSSFSRLALLSRRIGICEICAYAACTGC